MSLYLFVKIVTVLGSEPIRSQRRLATDWATSTHKHFRKKKEKDTIPKSYPGPGHNSSRKLRPAFLCLYFYVCHAHSLIGPPEVVSCSSVVFVYDHSASDFLVLGLVRSETVCSLMLKLTSFRLLSIITKKKVRQYVWGYVGSFDCSHTVQPKLL